jgi:hypothetical protein
MCALGLTERAVARLAWLDQGPEIVVAGTSLARAWVAVLTSVVEQALDAAGADRGKLIRVVDAAGTLETCVWLARPGALPLERFSASIVQHVLEHGERCGSRTCRRIRASGTPSASRARSCAP